MNDLFVSEIISNWPYLSLSNVFNKQYFFTLKRSLTSRSINIIQLIECFIELLFTEQEKQTIK